MFVLITIAWQKCHHSWIRSRFQSFWCSQLLSLQRVGGSSSGVFAPTCLRGSPFEFFGRKMPDSALKSLLSSISRLDLSEYHLRIETSFLLSSCCLSPLVTELTVWARKDKVCQGSNLALSLQRAFQNWLLLKSAQLHNNSLNWAPWSSWFGQPWLWLPWIHQFGRRE